VAGPPHAINEQVVFRHEFRKIFNLFDRRIEKADAGGTREIFAAARGAGEQSINHRHLVPDLDESRGDMAANKAGTSGYQAFHGVTGFFSPAKCSR
jgi:hypothetical protein